MRSVLILIPMLLLCVIDPLINFLPSSVIIVVIVHLIILKILINVHALILFLPPLHPVNHPTHPLNPIPIIVIHLLHLRHMILPPPPKIPPHNSLQLLPILNLHVFHVLLKSLFLVSLVNINCIVNQLLQLFIKILTVVFVIVGFTVDVLYVVVVLFVVRSELRLLLEKCVRVFPLLLSSFFLLLHYYAYFTQFFELFELQCVVILRCLLVSAFLIDNYSF